MMKKHLNKSASDINPFYNRDEEEVLKLNLGNYNNKSFNNNESFISQLEENNINNKKYSISFLKIYSKNKIKNLYESEKSIDNSLILKNIEKKFSSLNGISKSIKNLQTLVPDLLEKISSESSRRIFSAPRVQHMEYENYLHQILNDLNKKEKNIKKNKERLEDELKNIEETICDKQLNIDIIMNMDSFKKMYQKKVINHYENEFNKKEEEKLELSNINLNSNNNSTITNYSINGDSHTNKKRKSSITLKDKVNDKLKKDFKIQHLLRAKAFRAKLNNFILKGKRLTLMRANELEKEVNIHKINKKIINDDLLKINQKLKDIHNNKKNIIDKLYIHYLAILKEGVDTRDEGLAWVICEILSLGKKVMMSFLPKYLDENCVLYLFEMAHLIMAIKCLEKKFNESKYIFIKKPKTKKSIVKDMDNKKYFKSMRTLNNLKEKFCNNSSLSILNSSKNNSKDNTIINNLPPPTSLRRRRVSIGILAKAEKSSKNSTPTFIHGDPNHYDPNERDIDIPNIYKFKDINKYTLKNNDFLKTNLNTKFKECILLNKEIAKLRKIKEYLKNKEMCRIFDEYQKNKYYQKYNVDKKTLLNALIGEEKLVTELYNQNKKEKLLNDKILKTRLYKREYIKKNILYMNKSSLNLKSNLNKTIKDNQNLNIIINSNINNINNNSIKNNNHSFIENKNNYFKVASTPLEGFLYGDKK